MNALDLSPLWLSVKLASVTTLLLLACCLPLAWWLGQQRGPLRAIVVSLSTLPLVLPPSVLGFYLLLLLGSNGPLNLLGLQTLAFSFTGLVIASMIYSLPFVLQPLVSAFQGIDPQQLEAAATLRASPTDRFCSIVIPLARPAVITAAVLGFAHTMGEFGVILMIGGSIPGETRVLSVAIYEHVEALEYAQAHTLAALMLAFSLLVLLSMHWLNRRQPTLPVANKHLG